MVTGFLDRDVNDGFDEMFDSDRDGKLNVAEEAEKYLLLEEMEKTEGYRYHSDRSTYKVNTAHYSDEYENDTGMIGNTKSKSQSTIKNQVQDKVQPETESTNSGWIMVVLYVCMLIIVLFLVGCVVVGIMHAWKMSNEDSHDYLDQERIENSRYCIEYTPTIERRLLTIFPPDNTILL